jgi:general secretion pathway protein N
MAAWRPDVQAPWGWLALGCFAGLAIALAVCAPARWGAWAIDAASGGRVRLEAPRGTLWNGSGHLVLAGGTASLDAAALPSRVGWRLRPGREGMWLTLSADCCTPVPWRLRITASQRGFGLAWADGPATHWPAQLLAGLGTPWNTLGLDGRLTVTTRDLRLQWTAQGLRMEGYAALELRDATTRLTPLQPVGSYRLQLEGGDTPRLRLDTPEGALRLSGTGAWVGRHLRFTGEAHALPGTETVLDNVLNIIGQRQGARSLITLG